MKNSCWECPNRPRKAPATYSARAQIKRDIFLTFLDELHEGESKPHPVVDVVRDVCGIISNRYYLEGLSAFTVRDWDKMDDEAVTLLRTSQRAMNLLGSHPRLGHFNALLDHLVNIAQCGHAGDLKKVDPHHLIDWVHRHKAA